MWNPSWILTGLLALPVALEVQTDAPAAQEAQSPSEQLAALEQEMQAAMEAFQEAYGAAETDEERQRAIEELYPKPDTYAPRYWAIAKAAPASEAGLQAAIFVLENGALDLRRESFHLLMEHHADSERLADVCMTLGRGSMEGARALRQLVELSPHDLVKGSATYWLGKNLLDSSEQARRIQSLDEAEQELYAAGYGEEGLKALLAANPDELVAEAELCLMEVKESYGAVAHPWRGTLGAAAKGDLFELRNLGIGKVAPEIEGEDVDGVAFKLSDYRGKVVLLDFWGNW